MDEALLKVLSNCALFQGISPEETAVLLPGLQPAMRRFAKNEFLALAGEKFLGIGILVAGSAAVIKENASGERSILALLGPGDLFGEMAAFSKKMIWPATIIALRDCQAVFLPPEKIVDGKTPDSPAKKQLIINLLHIISEKALHLNKKLEYLGIKTIRGKISAFLLEQQAGRREFTLPFKRHELADYLHVSRPALSRELGRLREEGIIDFQRSQVTILDEAAMRQYF